MAPSLRLLLGLLAIGTGASCSSLIEAESRVRQCAGRYEVTTTFLRIDGADSKKIPLSFTVASKALPATASDGSSDPPYTYETRIEQSGASVRLRNQVRRGKRILHASSFHYGPVH